MLNRAEASEKENGEGVGNGCCDWELADTGDTAAMGLQATTNISPSCFIFLVCCPSPTAPSFKEMVPQTASNGFFYVFWEGVGGGFKINFVFKLGFYNTLHLQCVFVILFMEFPGRVRYWWKS